MLGYEYHGVPLSLFNISKYMLNYSKMDDVVHRVWADNLEQQRLHHKRILKLKPRGTYKTSLFTVSQCVELLMQDWLDNNRQFTKRILIASATEELASQMLGEISAHFRDNKNIIEFFGYNPVRSDKHGELWLTPKRISKEPTIKAKGALSALVSEHYDIIFCDDIVNSEDRESQAKREKNWRWYKDVISILEPDGYLGVWGTRWHFDDVYQRIFDVNKKLPEDQKYSIEVEAAVDDVTGKTLFPTILTDNKIASLKIEKGLVEFYAQYLNKCVPTETQLFPLEKMHTYTDYGPQSEDQFKGRSKTIAYCDPSLGRSEKGDYMVIIIGTIWEKRLYIRDVFMSNTTTPEKAAKIAEQMMDLYNVHVMYMEANGFQTLYTNFFREKGIPIIEYRNMKNKEVRIEGLEPYYTSGKIMFRQDWESAYQTFIEQLNMYPAGNHDDAPDALEGITKIAFGKSSGKMDPAGLITGMTRLAENSQPAHPTHPGRPWR
jgi:predicted phage terminase large subunit-like protein